MDNSKPRFINSISKAIPKIIPGRIRGNWERLLKSCFPGKFALTKKKAPLVPTTTAILTAVRLTCNECISAAIRASSLNNLIYHLVVKPENPTIDFVGLKEKTITTTKGK